MNRVRLRAMTAGLLLAPVLAGCGDDTAPDASDGGTSATPGASASEAPSEGATPEGIDFAGKTMAKSALSAEQADLYEELLLFEETALAQAGDGYGGGSGTFTDEADDDFNLPKPEGIRVATAYEIEWADGEVTSYSLETDTGEELRWEEDKVYVDHAIDSPEDSVLEQDLATLATAVEAWIAEYGNTPSVSSSFDTVTLEPGVFDESEAEEVEIEMSDSVEFKGFERYGDELQVEFTSAETGENAVLTEKGTTFSMPLEIV